MKYKAMAQAALDARTALVTEIRALDADSRVPYAEKREALKRMNDDVTALENEARGYVDQAEREQEVRNIAAAAGGSLFTPEARNAGSEEMPSWGEIRALTTTSGAAVMPKAISQNVHDAVRITAPVLATLTEMVMTGKTLDVPVVSGSSVSVTVEGNAHATSEPTLSVKTLTAVKFGALVPITWEASDDSNPAVQAIVVRDLAGACGEKISAAITEGLVGFKGLKDVAVLSGAVTLNKDWLDIISASIAEQRTAGLTPTALVMSPAVWSAIESLRDSTKAPMVNVSVAGATQQSVYGIPVTLSAQASAVYLVSGSRVIYGKRSDAEVLASDAPGFSEDVINVKVRCRFAGVEVTSAKAVLRLAAPTTA